MFTDAKAEPVVPVSDLERARSFYGGTLGLKELERFDEMAANPMIRYEIGGSSLMLYKSVGAGESRHTLVGFIVDDLGSVVEELRARGVTFEEYDMGDIKTENGIATIGENKAAWFKDPDGNILGVGEYA